MTSKSHPDKALLKRFLQQLSSTSPRDRAALAEAAYSDCIWKIFHPFNRLEGNHAAHDGFFAVLRTAMPDAEWRCAFMLAGEYEGRRMVSCMGHILGTFDAPLAGIPPTYGLAILRFGIHATVRDGRMCVVHVLLDLVDLMHQAGVYPFRPMPGSPQQWPFPPCDSGATALAVDPDLGADSLQIVHEMQMGLPKPAEIAALSQQQGKHSHHWHEQMNWYGPAGIGSVRGLRGFRDFHGALFLQAFPDRTGFPRSQGWNEHHPGHHVRIGDGHFVVTGGWPSLHATHLGPEWLGLPPTGRKVEMRVADWYRLTNEGKIIDNWVLIDIPHIVHQMGLDLFHDLEFRTDPSRMRLPLASTQS